MRQVLHNLKPKIKTLSSQKWKVGSCPCSGMVFPYFLKFSSEESLTEEKPQLTQCDITRKIEPKISQKQPDDHSRTTSIRSRLFSNLTRNYRARAQCCSIHSFGLSIADTQTLANCSKKAKVSFQCSLCWTLSLARMRTKWYLN